MGINGVVISRNGSKQEDGSRIYIIHYRIGKGEHRICLTEEVDTDVSFHSGHQIEIKTRDGLTIVTNNTLPGRVEGIKI